MTASPTSAREPGHRAAPVREITVGMYFRPLFALRNLQLVAALERWRPVYPRVEEVSRLGVWRSLTAAEAGVRALYGTSTPRYVLTTPDGRRSLEVQNDRLLLLRRSYARDSPHEHPGYPAVRDELALRFTELVAALRPGGVRPVPETADVTLHSFVDMDVRDFCVGVLTGWSSTRSACGVGSVYSGLRLDELDGDPDGTQARFSAEMGSGEEGTEFMIEVERRLPDGETVVDALGEAHATALRHLGRLIGDELMGSWGR